MQVPQEACSECQSWTQFLFWLWLRKSWFRLDCSGLGLGPNSSCKSFGDCLITPHSFHVVLHRHAGDGVPVFWTKLSHFSMFSLSQTIRICSRKQSRAAEPPKPPDWLWSDYKPERAETRSLQTATNLSFTSCEMELSWTCRGTFAS